ncbi:MAG: phage holin family protein [Candidatus Omnitrophica bacterium]|nr:phage holin family protein [Candidatus Omnitrophota bacterium]
MFIFLIRWIIDAVSLAFVVWLFPNVSVDSWRTLLLAAFCLGLVNATLKPFLLLWTLPLSLLTFGFFTFVINGLLFYGVSKFVKGFFVENFTSAFLAALVMSIVSFIGNILLAHQGKMNIYFYRDNWSTRRYKDSIDVRAKKLK